jgi:hypothetical protein
MDKNEIIQKAIKHCEDLIERYDNNKNIDDLDICYLIEILKVLKGRG